MPSDSSASTLDHLFNALNERADNSFQALKSHHQKIAQLRQTCNGLKGENLSLRQRCDDLERSLSTAQEELAAAQEASLQVDVRYTESSAESFSDSIGQEQAGDSELTEELKSENLRLGSELESLKQANKSLENSLNDLQQRLKSLLEGGLLDSSEAIRTLIRETLDPTEWPATLSSEETDEPARLEKFDAKEILAFWAERYPKAFSTVNPQPLKVGIHEDLASSGSLPDHWIRRALAGYVKSPRYLRVLKTGAVRMDLCGNNAGFVSAEEAGHAKEQLDTIRLQRLEKEKALREKEEKKRLSNKLSQLLAKK